MSILMSFANQKGGVGKSTISSLLANQLNGELNLIVIDCDDKQESLTDERRKELAEEQKRYPDQDFSDIYKIVSVSSAEFNDYYLDTLNGSFDLVIGDFPGNIVQPGVMASVALCDFLFVPFNLTGKDMDSTKKFVDTLLNKVALTRARMNLPDQIIYGVLAKLDTKSIEYSEYLHGGKEKIEIDMGIKMLHHVFPYNRVVFQRQSSTIYAYEKADMPFSGLCNEILNIMGFKIKL